MVKEKSCGEAVVRSYLQWLYKCPEAGYFPLESDCSSFYLQKKELERLGVGAEAYGVGKVSALVFFRPFIAQIQKENLFHFVLVFFFGRLSVLFFDPAEGMKLTGRKTFLSFFEGKILCGKLKERKPVPDVSLWKEKEKIAVFFLLVLASAGLGFLYFSLPSFPFLVSFLSLLSSALFFYLEKAYVLHVGKRISFETESPYLSLKGKEGLFLFERYKRRMISDTEERIETFCSLVLSLYFLYFCPMEEVYLSLFYFGYTALLYLASRPFLKRGILRLEKEERETFHEEFGDGRFKKAVMTGQKEGAGILLTKLLFFVPAALFAAWKLVLKEEGNFLSGLPFFVPIALAYSFLNKKLLALGKERKETLYFSLGKEIEGLLPRKGKKRKKGKI